MEEYNIDRELEMLLEDIPVQEEDFEKKVDKYIKKKIKTITVKTVLALVLITGILLLLISPAMDAMFLNPVKLQKDDHYESVLRDYYDLTRPYIEIGNVNIKKKGFARYELGISAVDYHKTKYVGTENVRMDVVRGEYRNVSDPGMYLTKMAYSLDEPMTEEEKVQMISDFQKLPESARITLLIYDKHVRDVAELRKEKVELDWVEVYHPNKIEFQGGINLHRTMIYDNMDLREELTEEELLQVYRDNLENLISYPEVWKSLGLYRHSTVWSDSLDIIKKCCEDAKTLEKLQTQYYYISGEKEEVIEYLEKTDVQNVFVHDVKSSIWE